MDQGHFYDQLNDRMRRYGASPLDSAQPIAITASPEYLATYDGQVAALVACNLLGRLSPSVHIAFADRLLHCNLPWTGRSLVEQARSAMFAANPFGVYSVRNLRASDHRFHLGPTGADALVHGTGWNAYIGSSPSPLAATEAATGIGAALAVILGAAHLFRTRFGSMSDGYACNAWNWTNELSSSSHAIAGTPLGHVMTVGLGSVGSAANYFLALATRNFSATLVDHDRVGVHNITRSPIFTNVHAEVELPKVQAVEAFLTEVGVATVATDSKALHLSSLWNSRPSGTPDVVISAANEFNVRYHIEMGFPPIQLYATTGRNGQVTLMRHRPGDRCCSLCLFPPETAQAQMRCATAPTAPAAVAAEAGQPVDAALPFLSFAAGLMTAAEILKLTATGYPFSSDRVLLGLNHDPVLVGTPLSHRAGCVCENRNQRVHRGAVAGSRYVNLTGS